MNSNDLIEKNKNKYIILYCDNEYIENNFINEIYNKYQLKIIKLLLNTDDKNININENIIEIYPDKYTEDKLIKDCFCIIYLSKIIRSNTLLNLIEIYNKYVIFNESFINYNIELILNNNFKENNDDFKNIYLSLTKNIENNTQQNIKVVQNKLITSYEKDKINIITFFKNTDIKILNIIQKKCISENLKNNNVNQIIVLGHNIIEELKDIADNKLILYESEENISYKNLLDISNKVLENKIICMIRSDIILPNQNNLDDLDIDILTSFNEIIAISRIDRLINGNLLKSDKLNKILFSTEQDAWIFRSPLNINSSDLVLLENVFFYDKYSELYFNKILKSNGFNIINNTKKYKIIRVLYENIIDNRTLINNDIKINNTDNVFLLPDNESFDKISIDQLFKFFNLNEKDVYNVKCELFNKYLKNKIINELK